VTFVAGKPARTDYRDRLRDFLTKDQPNVWPKYLLLNPKLLDKLELTIQELEAMVDRLRPPFNLVVTHVGIDNAELGAMLDMNTDGALPDMSKNRQGELDAITSQRFRDAIKAHNVQLLTYRQLIAMQGLGSMHRPQG